MEAPTKKLERELSAFVTAVITGQKFGLRGARLCAALEAMIDASVDNQQIFNIDALVAGLKKFLKDSEPLYYRPAKTILAWRNELLVWRDEIEAPGRRRSSTRVNLFDA